MNKLILIITLLFVLFECNSQKSVTIKPRLFDEANPSVKFKRKLIIETKNIEKSKVVIESFFTITKENEKNDTVTYYFKIDSVAPLFKNSLGDDQMVKMAACAGIDLHIKASKDFGSIQALNLQEIEKKYIENISKLYKFAPELRNENTDSISSYKSLAKNIFGWTYYILFYKNDIEYQIPYYNKNDSLSKDDKWNNITKKLTILSNNKIKNGFKLSRYYKSESNFRFSTNSKVELYQKNSTYTDKTGLIKKIILKNGSTQKDIIKSKEFKGKKKLMTLYYKFYLEYIRLE